MRVLHVAEALSPNFGGVQSVLRDLSMAQVRFGLDVDVLATNVDSPTGIVDVPPNVFAERDGVRLRHSSVQFRPLLFSLDVKR